MKDELRIVSWTQSKFLKEMGFPQRTFQHVKYYEYDGHLVEGHIKPLLDNTFAPSLQQVRKWLLVKKDIAIQIMPLMNKFKDKWYYIITKYDKWPDCEDYGWIPIKQGCSAPTYYKEEEDALNAAINRVITYILTGD